VVGGHRLLLGSQSQWNFSKRLRLRIPFSQTTGLICNDDRQKPSHRTSGFASASKRHWTQKVRRRKGVASTSSGRLSPISPGAGVAKWLLRSRTVNQQAANAGEVDLDRLRFRRSHL